MASLHNLHHPRQATQQVWRKTRPTHSDSKRMIPVFNPNPGRFIGAFPCVHPVFLLPHSPVHPHTGTSKGFTGFSSHLLAPAASLHILLWDSKDLHPQVTMLQQQWRAIGLDYVMIPVRIPLSVVQSNAGTLKKQDMSVPAVETMQLHGITCTLWQERLQG